MRPRSASSDWFGGVPVSQRPEPRTCRRAGNFSASIPALPGCHTQGETLDEVRANLREAAEGWLAVAHADGLTHDAAAEAS